MWDFIFVMLGWYAKEIKQELDDARKEITNVQINYVHKEELKQFRTEVIDLLKEVRQDIKELKDK